MFDNNSDLHTDADHHEEHVVFRKFHLWTQIPSTTLLLIVMILGSLANSFVSYCLYKKKIGTDYLNPVLFLISLKNIIAITLCIPLAIVMLNIPTTIHKVTCAIQEDVTYIVVFSGFLFPAFLSVIQCDRIIRHQRSLFTRRRVKIMLCVVCGTAVILGMQSQIQNDEHGCHLWSIRTDNVVLTYIYSVAIIVCSTVIVMTASYVLIYYHARAHQGTVRQMPRASRDLSNRQIPREGLSGAFSLTTRAHSDTIQRAIPQGNNHTGLRQTPSTNSTSIPNHISRESRAYKDQTEGNNLRPIIANEVSTMASYVPYKRKMTTAILKPMFCIVANNLLTSLPWIVLYTSTVDHTFEDNTNYAEMRVLTMSIIYIPIAAEPIIFLAFSTKGRKALRTVWNNVMNARGSSVPTRNDVSVLQTAYSNA